MKSLTLRPSADSRPGPRRFGRILAGTGLLLVLSLTLWPSADPATHPIGPYCLFCGNRGLADAILNTLLFTPFGAGLALLFNSTAAVVGSALLSAGVELAQTGMIGRFPTLGDVVFNTLGGGCGALMVYLARALPVAIRHPSTTLTLSAVLAPLGVFFLTAALVSPSYPETGYFGQWKHEIGHLIPYPGEILSASVGSVPLRDGLSHESAALRLALEDGEPIRLSFVAAASVPEETHLLAIFDDAETLVFLITALGQDVRFQWRSRSAILLLDRPFTQWEGVMPDTPGKTSTVELWRDRRTLCMTVESHSRCSNSWGVEEGWRLLYRASSAPSWLLAICSAVWLVFLCVPAGVVMPAAVSKGALLGAGLGGVAVAVSWGSPFMNPHLVTFMAPLVGVLAGTMIRRVLLQERAKG